MGDPKFPRRSFDTPSHPWQGERIKEEAEIVRQLKPPLNLTHAKTPWTDRVKAALKRMADEARRWRPKDWDGGAGDS